MLAIRIASFHSAKFTEVGLYSSSVLQNKYIFVGHEGLSAENSPTVNYRISAYDNSLHKYILQEQQVKLSDIKCEVCTKSFDCKGCKDLNSPVTVVQLEESKSIRQAMKVSKDPTDESKFIITIDYPTRDGVSLKDLYTEENSNRAMALKSSESLRNRLSKLNKLQDFHSQIAESIAKGHVAEITSELATRYKGQPISYQLINYVEKASSATTKMRVVTNSSIPRMGGSLNENLAQGINSLNSSLAVLNRFAAFPFAILTDLSQAYRSVYTGDATNSVRRFYWFQNPNDPTTVTEYCMQRMQFGDKPAGNILAEAINLISNQPEISSDCRDFLKCSFYVDDGAHSSSDKVRLERLADEFPSVFSKFNFVTKHVIKSWDLSSLAEAKTSTSTSESLFGLTWNLHTDEIKPVLSVHLGKKVRGMYRDEEISFESIESAKVTLRMLLRVVGSIYDLSGRHLGPLIFKTREMYSLAARLKPGWDVNINDLDPSLHSAIKQLMNEIVDVRNQLKPVQRAWVPVGGQLVNLIFPSDGSETGFSCVGYARSAVGTSFSSRNLGSRCKISNLSVQDNELCGYLLATKFALSTIRSLPETTDT